MKYYVNEICESCGGIMDLDDSDLYPGDRTCKCDEWENTAPEPEEAGPAFSTRPDKKKS